MQNNPLDKVNNWIKNSVTLKFITIIILMLLLLIPSSMIRTIISEREQLNNEAIAEVSAKWAGRQQLNGPILTIPLVYEYEVDEKIVRTQKYWHLLPEHVKVDAEVAPRQLRRGIYEVVVYESDMVVTGNFDLAEKVDATNLKAILYDKAFLTIGISDLKGIQQQIRFEWGDEPLQVKPGSRLPGMIYSGVTVDLPGIISEKNKVVPFRFSLALQGSQNLSFVPLGKTTDVHLASTWKAPSFNGNFLPDQRSVSDEGFEASWQILQLNRNFPQSWVDANYKQSMQEAAFGVDLILPLDDYQKSTRSAKYAAMTIALTFLIFFLVEILLKRKIHPFQYALVGLSLCLFYVLLVSLSEHVAFNMAYATSSLGIVAMISLYSLSVFKTRKQTYILTLTLVGIYGFMYVTLQLSDYALLLGSVGLTAILAITMYFTRNVNWYEINTSTE